MKTLCAFFFAILAACGLPGEGNSPGGNFDDTRSGDGSGSGGGFDSSSVAPYQSGTRIKARTTTTTITTADGAASTVSFFAGFVDSERFNEPCSPGLASDGVTRCLPGTALAYASYFADAACTIPVTAVIAGACGVVTPPLYISVPPPEAETCSASTLGPSIFGVGVSSASFFQTSGATCAGPTTIPDFTWYPRTGTEIPPSSFAEMTTTLTTTTL